MSMSSTSTITNISTTHKTTTSHINHTHRISNGAQACAACKYQRRKCAPDCILAPYFPHERQNQFLNAHKLFGVSNITKIIRNLKQHEKDIAMRTIMFQSDMRNKDPVGGCYRIATALQHQIAYVDNELQFVLQQIAMCRAHQAAYQQQQQQQMQISVNHDPDDKNNNDNPTTSSYEIHNCMRMAMMLVVVRFLTTNLNKTMLFRISSTLGVCKILYGFHPRDPATRKVHL